MSCDEIAVHGRAWPVDDRAAKGCAPPAGVGHGEEVRTGSQLWSTAPACAKRSAPGRRGDTKSYHHHAF